MTSPSNDHLDADPRTADFMRLVTQHDRQWKAYVLSLVPHWADADDILQDTKLELWERFAEYDPAGDFGAWARKIILYRVMTFRSQSGRDGSVSARRHLISWPRKQRPWLTKRMLVFVLSPAASKN